MICDERQKTLAKNLVTYSIDVKKGEKVWIDAFGIDVSFVNALVDAVYDAAEVSLAISIARFGWKALDGDTIEK